MFASSQVFLKKNVSDSYLKLKNSRQFMKLPRRMCDRDHKLVPEAR